MKHYSFMAYCLLIILLLAACRVKQAIQTIPANLESTSHEAYLQKIAANRSDVKGMTAKISADLSFADRRFSLGGTLNMKRNEGIQLSLTFMGLMEVGRIEFTKDSVYILDRINKRYACMPYSRVDFLHDAKIDFYTLQSLFWNELFLPGQIEKPTGEAFTYGRSGGYTLLSLSSFPKLDYAFLTDTNTGLIDRTTIKSKELSSPVSLVWKYASFEKFEGKPFPRSISGEILGTHSQFGLDITLKSLKADANVSIHTPIPPKYSEINLESILRGLTEF